MKVTRIFALLLPLVLVLGAFTQDAPPNPSTSLPAFSLNANAIALPALGSTNPATDVGASFALTDNMILRSDNILAPALNLQSYFGGVQYNLPQLAKLLSKTNLNSNSFQFYVTGSLGVAIDSATGPTEQHIAALAGGGLNYDPTGKGKPTLNLFELRWAKFPGLANSTAVFSSGIKFAF